MSKADGGRIEALAETLVRWRWLVVVLTLLGVGALASGARFLGFAGDYQVFFAEDNPQLLAFEDLQETYSKNDNVLFVVAPREGDAFSPQGLAALEALTEAGWKIPYSSRVDSIINFQHTSSEDDDLVVRDLLADAGSMGGKELARAREVALTEPRLVHQLVSPDGQVAGVNVTIHMPSDTPEQLLEVVQHCRRLAEDIRQSHDVDVYLTGVIMLNNAFVEATVEDMTTLVPLMYLGLLLLLCLFLRSFSATLGTLLVIVFSTLGAMGAAGWLGIALTPPAANAPTLITTLAVADSVHILVALLQALRRGASRQQAIAQALRLSFMPVLLTSVTTAIGFLCMNSSEAPPLHDLGNITAIGVVLAYLLSMLFLPALMAILPLRVKIEAGATAKRQVMLRLADWVILRRKPLFAVGTLIVIALAACIPLNVLNEQFVQYFHPRTEFRQHTDFTLDHLTGLYQVEYALASGEPGGIADPAYLETLGAFTDWWRQQPEAVHVNSLSDVMKRLNRSMHGDDGAFYALPEDRQLAAQYLLLYELSLSFGLDLTNQIDLDKSATRVTVTLGDLDSSRLIEVATRGEAWLRQNAPAHMATFGVGSSIIFAHIAERNIYSMLRGTVLGLVLISCLLMLALGSLRYGVLSLVPNLVPAILGFGIWGLWVGQVGFGLSIVMAMTLGIVVDDTVHFLSKYLLARRRQGASAEEAIRYAFGTVGEALVVTSLVLMGGFLILAMSSFAQNSDMGRLTALIIVLALVADFFLLPPLLLWLDGGRREAGSGASHPRESAG